MDAVKPARCAGQSAPVMETSWLASALSASDVVGEVLAVIRASSLWNYRAPVILDLACCRLRPEVIAGDAWAFVFLTAFNTASTFSGCNIRSANGVWLERRNVAFMRCLMGVGGGERERQAGRLCCSSWKETSGLPF